MELKKAIENRYSVRGYLDKDVKKDAVKNILEVAKRAPSGVNSQPWKVYVVMGDTRDNLVKEACEKFDKGEMEKEEYQVYPIERPDW
jgi:nitroreductase